MKISPARIAAFDVLLRIERDRGQSSTLLAETEDRLSDADRALCHQLVLGVLRKQTYLDAITARFGTGRKLDREVATALRLGLFQILFLDRIPDHSAVNDSVELVRRARKGSAKGMVNAILRRATREAVHLEYRNEIERISIETSHPVWLIERWAAQSGTAEAEAIAAANNLPARAAFRQTVKGIENDAPISQKAVPSGYVEGCFRVDSIDREIRESVQRGEIYFQDEGSQLIASLVSLPQNGSFLDVCAAPGGKTGSVAARSIGRNATIVAGDISRKRTAFLKANCERQGAAGVRMVRYDAEAALPFSDRSFDAVLLDSPCTGTGTIRSNPEIRYFLEPGDIKRLQSKQLAILSNASKLVRRGGFLVYSTCSLEREENEEVIETFLAGNDGFRLVRPDLRPELLTKEGYVRTSVAEHDTDGFFAAVIERL